MDRYRRRLAWSDAAIVAVAIAVAHWVRFGSDPQVAGPRGVPMSVAAVLIGIAWIVSLRATNSMDRRVLGSGSSEYSRVVTACLTVFGLWAMVDVLFRLNVSRGFLLIALPLGTFLLLLSRWAWRKRLHARYARAQDLERLLVIGDARSAVPLIARLHGQPTLGFDVVGVCLPSVAGRASNTLRVKEDDAGTSEVPVLGTFDEVIEAVMISGASTVAVTSAEALGHAAMQDLSWDLEGLDVDMLVAPGVTDVAGPRMTVRPVAGLPLLHIDKPRYEGANRFRKAAVDRVGAATLLFLFAPLLLVAAIAVKVDTPGSVFYRGTRVGVNNKPFRMWKFRSMVADADKQKAALAEQDEGAGVLFKMRDDPRVTRVGQYLRRYSIDELPQLFNVITGEMSLVGPRPPLPEEVAQYDGRIARRMLVKPGLTGLWQVSGRSDLPWEEAVRLDLSYVENWSIMQDLLILWRTARAVLDRTGAY